MRRLGGRMYYIMVKADMSVLELMMGLWYVSFVRFLLFGNPSELANNPSYQPMGEIAPQWFWGASFLLAGILKVVGTCLYRVLDSGWGFRATEIMRFTGAGLGAILWATFATVLVLSNPSAPGLIGYMAFACTCSMTALRHVSWLSDLFEWSSGLRH